MGEFRDKKLIGSRYSDIYHKSIKLAAKVTESEATTLLVSSALDKSYNQVENILKGGAEENTAASCIGEESENHIKIEGI